MMLAVSLFVPYWRARLVAPQFPRGLSVLLYAHGVGGDVDEVDELNHYVGVAKLGSLAKWERRTGLPAVLALTVICLGVPFLRNARLRWALAAGVWAFPPVFVLDLGFWMRYASTHLDPTAALKLKPFVIPVFGAGRVGQFKSFVGPMPGFFLAVAAGLLLAVALRRIAREKPAVQP